MRGPIKTLQHTIFGPTPWFILRVAGRPALFLLIQNMFCVLAEVPGTGLGLEWSAGECGLKVRFRGRCHPKVLVKKGFLLEENDREI
jgi:hypothetical protein